MTEEFEPLNIPHRKGPSSNTRLLESHPLPTDAEAERIIQTTSRISSAPSATLEAALSQADAATRESLVQRLQQSVGNATVHRHLATTASPLAVASKGRIVGTITRSYPRGKIYGTVTRTRPRGRIVGTITRVRPSGKIVGTLVRMPGRNSSAAAQADWWHEAVVREIARALRAVQKRPPKRNEALQAVQNALDSANTGESTFALSASGIKADIVKHELAKDRKELGSHGRIGKELQIELAQRIRDAVAVEDQIRAKEKGGS